MNPTDIIQQATAHLQLIVYELQMGLSTIGHHLAVVWLIGAILTPLLSVLLLFMAAASDFRQIIHLQISFSRLFGDLLHVLMILVAGFVAEIFFLYELFVYFFH